MFGIGGFELFIILIFGFLIFGPDKLPDIAKTVGRGIARFRQAQQEMNEVIGNEKIIDFDNPDEPFKDPVEALDRIAQRQEEKRASAKAASAKAAPTKQGPAGGAAEDASAKGAPEKAGERPSGSEAEKEAEPPAPDGPNEVPNSGASAVGAPQAESGRKETFTERKARYERERAARKAAQADAEKNAAEMRESQPDATDVEAPAIAPAAESGVADDAGVSEGPHAAEGDDA